MNTKLDEKCLPGGLLLERLKHGILKDSVEDWYKQMHIFGLVIWANLVPEILSNIWTHMCGHNNLCGITGNQK